MIGLRTLYELGYRVAHAKNIALATTTLERIKKGVVTHDEINRAIAALKHAPLSQSTVLVLNDTPAGGQTNED